MVRQLHRRSKGTVGAERYDADKEVVHAASGRDARVCD
jgi:hypothetical protein